MAGPESAAFSVYYEIQEEPHYIGARKWAMSYTLSPWEALEKADGAHLTVPLYMHIESCIIYLIAIDTFKVGRCRLARTNAAYCFKCSSLNRLE